MLKLIIATSKQFYRNKEAVFWTLVFPMIFLFVFRLFDFSGSVNANIIVIGDSEHGLSGQIVSTLQNVNGIGINTSIDDLEEAKQLMSESQNIDFKLINKDEEKGTEEEEIKSRQPNVIIVIPEDYGLSTPEKHEITIYYDNADEGLSSPSGIVESIINNYTDAVYEIETDRKSPFTTKREGISVNDVTYFDSLVPGIIGMSIMQSGIIGIATAIATFKEKRITKRLSATPLPSWKFILAEVITFLIASMIQTTLILFIGVVVLGSNIYGSIPLIYFMNFIACFVFLNLGFIAVSFTKSTNAAAGLANAITTPMMFLSGVFFVRETLPEGIKLVADYLPLSPLIDALRAIMLQDKGIWDLQQEIFIILVWTIVSFVISAKVFKFSDE